MKKIFLLLFFLVSLSVFSQSVFEAKSTTDRAVVENFIRNNPKHPAVPELKQRALSLKYGGSSAVAKPTVTAMTENKIEKTSKVGTTAAKGQPSEQAKNTAAVLTSLFNNDPNKKEAIVQFVNKSKCVLVIKISGKKFYNLSVPANGQNYIMVDKGSYNVSTSICDATYNQNKAFTKDVIITLKGN
ncbi:DUF6759 domain-containing protein [Epilithonimonas zeae]|uniref:DUF6759 domain-containing protein n=1 Tax=Epilithonimonas zeae TaxID=1416779 RepID=UPI00200FC5A3|nr:DUF6759 domain-containing protein [Epilithonimonas zeae]UQB67310.1 hypothetical protein KI430_09635 [Epilithonimonas zeae]